jgi:hypothetical protein
MSTTQIHPFVQKAIQRVKLGLPKPLWYETITQHYPPLMFHQPQPLRQTQLKSKSDTRTQRRDKIQKISYPEDQLRLDFYKKFPLELTKPIELEDNDPKHLPIAEKVIRYQASLLQQGRSYEESQAMAIEYYHSLSKETSSPPSPSSI